MNTSITLKPNLRFEPLFQAWPPKCLKMNLSFCELLFKVKPFRSNWSKFSLLQGNKVVQADIKPGSPALWQTTLFLWPRGSTASVGWRYVVKFCDWDTTAFHHTFWLLKCCVLGSDFRKFCRYKIKITASIYCLLSTCMDGLKPSGENSY